jgi:hypothetical protein
VFLSESEPSLSDIDPSMTSFMERDNTLRSTASQWFTSRKYRQAESIRLAEIVGRETYVLAFGEYRLSASPASYFPLTAPLEAKSNDNHLISVYLVLV